MNHPDFDKQFFNPNSFFGALNYLKRPYGSANVLEYSRPLYPPLMSNPQLADIILNFNKSELGIMTFFSLLSLRIISKELGIHY